jgi:hypothetical protein
LLLLLLLFMQEMKIFPKMGKNLKLNKLSLLSVW